MKLFIKHFEEKTFSDLLQDIKHIDFSLFVDNPPSKQEDLSAINIFVLQEPNEYFGLHDYVIKNKELFSFVLTWDDKVINNCENAVFLPFGAPWVTSAPDINKKFEITHLSGKLLIAPGHIIRHELLARVNEFKVPTDFHKEYGVRFPYEEAIKTKIELFNKSQYGICIENTSHNGYFTEKITDLFIMKTIPIYCGCSNIDKFFNLKGIIIVRNADELIEKSNNLTPEHYSHIIDAINENFERTKNFLNYEIRICNKIREILTFNKII